MRTDYEGEHQYDLSQLAEDHELDGGGKFMGGRRRTAPPIANRPLLTLWTISGFPRNVATLNQSQLAEIGRLAAGLARNPRTRVGKPLLTITGGFDSGENAGVANRRAISVRDALIDAIKRIDRSLLASLGFDLAAEPRGREVAISLRERNPPPPDLHLPQDYQPHNPLAPTGTPLPPMPSSGRPAPGLLDRLRHRIDRILWNKGVKNEIVRKAITDSLFFQIEQTFKSMIGKAGVDFKKFDDVLTRRLPR